MAKTFFFKFGSGNPATNTGLSPTLIYFYDQSGTTLAAPAISEALTGSGIYKFTYTPTLAIAFVADGATTSLATADRYVTAALDPVQTVDQPVNDTTYGVSAMATKIINGLVPGYSLEIAGYSIQIAGYSTQISGYSIQAGNFATLFAGYSNLILGYSNLLAGESLLLVGYSNLISGYSTQVAGYSLSVAGLSNVIAGQSSIIAGISSIVGGISLNITGISLILSGIGLVTDSYGGVGIDPTTLFGFMKRNLEFNEGNQTYTKTPNTWLISTRGSSALITKTLTDTQTQTTKS